MKDTHGTGPRLDPSSDLAHLASLLVDLDVEAALHQCERGRQPTDPASDNLVEGNQITGYRMKTHCIILADKVDLAANTVRGNNCADASPVSKTIPGSSLKNQPTNEYDVMRPLEGLQK